MKRSSIFNSTNKCLKCWNWVTGLEELKKHQRLVHLMHELWYFIIIYYFYYYLFPYSSKACSLFPGFTVTCVMTSLCLLGCWTVARKTYRNLKMVSAVMKLAQSCCADTCEPWYFLSQNSGLEEHKKNCVEICDYV